MQLAHEVREVSRERGRNEVGECGPQTTRKRQRELHLIERYLGRTAHRDGFFYKEPSKVGVVQSSAKLFPPTYSLPGGVLI
jgi:hypothetical protein